MWTNFPDADARAITTNGDVFDRKNVMGVGTAMQAAQRFPELRYIIGALLTSHGNQCFYLPAWDLVTFPTKNSVRENSSLPLIERSCQQLTALADVHNLKFVVLPQPGCGAGGLKWKEVEPAIEPLLDDRFCVVSYGH